MSRNWGSGSIEDESMMRIGREGRGGDDSRGGNKDNNRAPGAHPDKLLLLSRKKSDLIMKSSFKKKIVNFSKRRKNFRNRLMI